MGETMQPGREMKCPLLHPEDNLELKHLQQFGSLQGRGWPGVLEEHVETDKGTFVVGVQGERGRTPIVTFHDLGMNYITSFETFFTFPDVRLILDSFCVYHVNAPGQEDKAAPLPEEHFEYPSLDEMAALLRDVLAKMHIAHFVGLGVGMGAYVLACFALDNPMMVDGLCLVNPCTQASGWFQWGLQKMYARNLRSSHEMSNRVRDFLLDYHLGREHDRRPLDLQRSLRDRLENCINPTNLAMLLGVFNSRTDLHMVREIDPEKKKNARMLKMPVLLVAGAESYQLEATEILFEKLDPSTASFMKVADVAMPLEEQPAKVAEAFRYFLQGLGFIPYMQRRISRQHSLAEQGSADSSPLHIHTRTIITEEK